MSDASKQVGVPASPIVQPGQPIPKGVDVQRQERGGLNSANSAGAELSVEKYVNQK